MKKYLCRIVRGDKDVVFEVTRAEFAEAAMQQIICDRRGKLEKNGCATSFGEVQTVTDDDFRSVNGDTTFVVQTLAAVLEPLKAANIASLDAMIEAVAADGTIPSDECERRKAAFLADVKKDPDLSAIWEMLKKVFPNNAK